MSTYHGAVQAEADKQSLQILYKQIQRVVARTLQTTPQIVADRPVAVGETAKLECESLFELRYTGNENNRYSAPGFAIINCESIYPDGGQATPPAMQAVFQHPL